jgi:hypothetical protein
MSVRSWFGKNKAWDIAVLSTSATPLAPAVSASSTRRFKLKPAKKKHKILYFTVDYAPGALPALWKKVTLFPRGNTPAPAPPALPAVPTQTDFMNAAAAIRSHLKLHASTTERLEGEIDVSGERASLTLVQIPKAVNGEALLCVFTTFDANRPGGSPNPDGTGGGHSVHP